MVALIVALTVCYVCKKKPSVPIALEAKAVSVPAVTGIDIASAASESKADESDDEKI